MEWGVKRASVNEVWFTDGKGSFVFVGWVYKDK